jgi:hypothetical protein
MIALIAHDLCVLSGAALYVICWFAAFSIGLAVRKTTAWWWQR